MIRSVLRAQRRHVRAMSTKYPPRGNRFEGKNIIVTGAAGNFGGICAKMLAAEGANIALVDLAEDKLPDVQKEVETYGIKARCFGMDLTDDTKVKNMVAEVKSEFGTIDGLFNNAGYQGAFAPVDQYPTDDFEMVMKINVVGLFSTLKYTAQAMIEQGNGGAIVNTASCAGLGCPTLMAAYGSSKAAVIHLSKISAIDLAPHNIRVNSISPAYIGPEDGYMWLRQVQLQAENNPTNASEYYFSNDNDTVAKQMIGSVPLRRAGKVEEVINAALFLLSEESSYMTGVDLDISGGNVIGGARG
uniref:Oxidoreductase n=1 Tax=Lotharella globosa TaxID=91324 RepID=A0A6U3CUV6_9EUKA|mmetsp:Transcript_20672/g.41723  ORF Transcript_20672/g.41723 Transcript_20672/m.41723 type:complete len:301 (-) Transcript_20672:623-1525(-)